MNRVILSVGLLSLSALLPSPARAGQIDAASSGGMDFRTSMVPTGTVGQLYVFTESTPVINGVVTATKNGAPIPAPAGLPITTGWFFTHTYVPIRTTGAFPKAAGDVFELTSMSTGTPVPLGTPMSVADAMLRVNAANTRLDTVADVTINKDAFARAMDPQFFGPGLNVFTHTLTDLTLTSDAVNTFAGYNVMVNSSLPGLGTLYTLEVAANGVLSSAADLFIDFRSNPLLGLSDAAMDAALRASFTVSGNTATLTAPLQIQFALNSAVSYSVDFESDSYAHADSTAAPEPSTLTLLGLGVGGLIRYGWRRRKPPGLKTRPPLPRGAPRLAGPLPCPVD
jgi:hypothetical protein